MKLERSLILSFCLTFTPCLVLAESPNTISSSLGRTSAYNNFSEVKTKITESMTLNRQLEAKYALISQDVDDLQARVAAAEEELKAYGIDVARYQNKRRATNEPAQTFDAGTLSEQNQILLKESKIAFLKNQSIDLDIQIKSYRQQLESLESQRNVTGEQARLTQDKVTQTLQTQSQEIQKYKQQYKALEYQYKLNQDRLSEMQKEGEDYSQKILALNRENSGLEAQMLQLKTDIEIKRKEVDILRDKRMLALRSAQLSLQPSEEERADLQGKLSALEEEYKNLDQTVQVSMGLQEDKKELITNIIRIDKENQGLKEKIAALQDQIEELK